MSNIIIEQYCVGDVATNCYFVINKSTKEMIITDPGDYAKMLADKIKEKELTPVAILLTHGHFDHAMAANELADKFDIQIYAHKKEEDLLKDPKYNLSSMIGKSENYHADIYVNDGEILELAGFSIKVLHTPGHTPGGCCYYIEKEQILLSGDTLFQQSVGRTDFPGSSMSQLIQGIREKLLVLPDHTKVYPGHMDSTTIGQERQYNPFI